MYIGECRQYNVLNFVIFFPGIYVKILLGALTTDTYIISK